MARTATTVKLSNIKINGTEEFYPVDFVETMKLIGKGEDQTEWPLLFQAMSASAKAKSAKADKLKAEREKKAKDRQDRVNKILKDLDVHLPEGVTIKSIEVKPKGPSVDVLDEEGNKTGEKEQTVTHFDIDLRWGERGNARLLRGSVSTGGERKPKSEEDIEAETDALVGELVGNLLKILA